MILTPKQTCSRIGFALLFMMLGWLVFAFVLSVVLGLLSPELMTNAWAMWLLNDIPLYGVGVVIFLLLLRRLPEPAAPERQRGRIKPLHLLWLVLLCLGATELINLVTTLAMTGVFNMMDKPMSGPLDEMQTGGGLAQNLLFGVLVPAVGEEYIFRYQLRRKMRAAGDGNYILLSGLCFGLFHGNIFQLFYAFALGCIFAWVYLYTGRLWLPMLLHGVVNFFGIIVIPGVAADERLQVLVGLLVLALSAGCIAIFVCFWGRVRRTMQPPVQPGWPHRPLRPRPANPLKPQQTQWQAQPAATMPAAYPAIAQAAPQPVGATAAFPAPPEQPAAYPAAQGAPYVLIPSPPPVRRNPYAQPPPRNVYGAYYGRPLPTMPTERRARFIKTCVLNGGVLLYIALSVVMTLVSLIAL